MSKPTIITDFPGQRVEEFRKVNDGMLPSEVPELDRIEQYRIQMAAISSAASGHWKEGEAIHSDYMTIPLRDVARLYQKYAKAQIAMRAAMDELGIPGEGYPANVKNAFDHLHRVYYESLQCLLDEDSYRPEPIKGTH